MKQQIKTVWWKVRDEIRGDEVFKKFLRNFFKKTFSTKVTCRVLKKIY